MTASAWYASCAPMLLSGRVRGVSEADLTSWDKIRADLDPGVVVLVLLAYWAMNFWTIENMVALLFFSSSSLHSLIYSRVLL